MTRYMIHTLYTFIIYKLMLLLHQRLDERLRLIFGDVMSLLTAWVVATAHVREVVWSLSG